MFQQRHPRHRTLVFLTSAAVVAGLAAAVPNVATAGSPCHVGVKRLHFESNQPFAGHSMIKRYSASVNYPVGTTYDQSAKVVMGVYPRKAYPTLLRSHIGTRTKTGEMVKNQAPHAVSAIDGDFFILPTIRGRTFEV
ncbi:MAG TPA: hypothetical protein VMT88_10440, partial [Actinomycetes bacterium]|nr:hypothetical protein [Actinomycetes bacterium]